MGRGEFYDVRLGKPFPVSDLRSEWYDWFLKKVDGCKPHRGSVTLWALGGAGFILRTKRSRIYVDPYLGGSVISDGTTFLTHRMIPIPFNASDVKNIDAVVMTHEDIDHMNEDFIFPVSRNTECIFVGPSSVADLLKSWGIPENRIISLSENEETRIGDVRIIAFDSNDPNAKTANTYTFDTGQIRMFHAGDSFFLDKFAGIGRKYDIDIAAISVGVSPPGAKWYNNPADAVQIARDLNARVLIPMHWDLWDLCLEDPYLVEQEARNRRTNLKVVVLRVGQRFDYPSKRN